MSDDKANGVASGQPGCVCAGDARTAAAGARILAEGGNAVDAAVGSVFAAFAAEPVLASAFGGGFATLCDGQGVEESWDFFAEVPGVGLGAPEDDPTLDFVSIEVSFGPARQTFHCGRAAAAVPLLLPGIVDLHHARGRLPLASVVAPAIELARSGVEVSAEIAPILAILEPILRLTPESAQIFAPGGRVLREGERYHIPPLVGLLERVTSGDKVPGRAELLDGFGSPRGRMTDADLDAAVARTFAPIRLPLPDGTCVLLPPPPASGGLLIAFSLSLLSQVAPAVWADPGLTAEHFLAVMGVTNEARHELLDPLLRRQAAPVEITEAFLGEASLAQWLPRFEEALRRGPRWIAPAADNHLGRTTHVSVIDADGTACAITHSNGEGCGHLVPGTGMQCNNFLGEEDLHPDGFHRDAPGTRLTSMMCPTVAIRDGRPVMAVGSGGSNRIRSAILQVLSRHLLAGQSLRESVEAPRIHLEGGILNVERRGGSIVFDDALLTRLESRVEELLVFDEPNMFFGGAHAVRASEEGGAGPVGAGDPRRGGAVGRV